MLYPMMSAALLESFMMHMVSLPDSPGTTFVDYDSAGAAVNAR
jgi:hypothetical protein